MTTCRHCARTLHSGELAWADDVKVIEPGGVRVVVRYTCDDCADIIEPDSHHPRSAPMSSLSDMVKRVSGVHDAIGCSLDQFGGFLRCETCRTVRTMGVGDAGRYTAKGWPRCCGYTMRWWTQRQINAGEVPQ